MSGKDRTGFDWKEIAGVLHIVGISSRVTFWQQIQCLRAKDGHRQSLAIDDDKECDADGGKPDTPRRESR